MKKRVFLFVGALAALLLLVRLGPVIYAVGALNDASLPIPLVSPAPDAASASVPTEPAAAAPSAAASATSSAAPARTLTVAATPTGTLHVRNTPSIDGDIVGTVNPGDVYGYAKMQNGWYQISLSDGTVGWVSGQYVTVN